MLLIQFLISIILSCAHSPNYPMQNVQSKPENSIRILSLNIGHGRGAQLHQILVGKKGVVKNIDRIAHEIMLQKSDIVALQEIDGPSIWSGSISHNQRIAKSSSLPYEFRGTHVRMPSLTYGTAILSKYPFTNTDSKIFTPSPPLPNKGFVWADISVQNQLIRVVSLHLDFARHSVRKKQLAEVSAVLQNSNIPLIVMGDFNTEWNSTMEDFCNQNNLQRHEASQKRITFPKTKKELDWILISNSLRFISYQVLPYKMSDHLAITATIQIESENSATK